MFFSVDNLSGISANSVYETPISASYFPSICSFRRALENDIEEINSLITPTCFSVFGCKATGFLIRKCYFSMVALNADNRIVAVICLDDHPNIPALPNSEWETWIKNLYNLESMTSQNTLWIHLIASHQNYTYTFAKPLLKNVFLNFPYLTHIIAVMPGNIPCFCFLEENFSCILPIGYDNPRTVQTLYLTMRNSYIKKYKIRLAVEEDNDDIVEIVDTHSTKLKEMYGEFYISELLTKFTDMDRHLIVAEVAERVSGVLILNGNVNYIALKSCFHLESFGNFFILDHDEYIKQSNSSLSISVDIPATGLFSGRALITEISRDSLPSEEEADGSQEEDISLSEIFDMENMEILNDEYLYTRDVLNEKCSQQDVPPDGTPGRSASDLDDNAFMADLEAIYLELPSNKKLAFTLELIAASEDEEEGCLCDLLEAAFQKFPEKQFCVFSVQHNQPYFPLLNYFVRAIPRNRTIYPHEVYVLHKNAVRPQLVVRKLGKKDYSDAKKLISSLPYSTTVLDAITKSVYSSASNLKSYILVNGTVIVGLIIISHANLDYYLEHYCIYKYVAKSAHRYNCCGMIEHCVLYLIFQRHLQFFLREVHRLSDMSILLYRYDRLIHEHKNEIKPLPVILRDMMPVLDRTQGLYKNMKLPEIELPTCLREKKEDFFALFISTRKLCSLPRFDINSRIVVVGSSQVGLSFLESLIFTYDESRQAIFNNLYLIYDRTVRDSIGLLKHLYNMFLYRGKYNANHLNSACFHMHVNYVNGTMTAIDRKIKYITVNKEKIVPYDYLFLTCGVQYHQPYGEGVRKDRVVRPCPENVFVINKYNDAELAFFRIFASLKAKRSATIVVYGSAFNAYSCLAALEKSRFPLSHVKFVEPIPDEHERPSMNPFNNPTIHEAFHDILAMIGIESHVGYYFHEWMLDVKQKKVVKVIYQSRKGAVALNCDFIFHYANKDVTFDTFSAINNAGLVFDGKLVIKPDCRTNDPNIFAAGPMTKYSKRYFADRYIHKYYSSCEIGARLGRQIRAMLLPGGLEANEGDPIFDILKTPDTDKLVPQYTDPKVTSCILPGGINYLDIHAPGKPVHVETQRYIGHVLETGNLKRIELDEDPEYFRLQLDKNDKVEQIVCFTRKEIEMDNYLLLWGKHERILNKLLHRFKNGLITNFYDFFRDPYFCAIYTDRFTDLQRNLTSIMTLLTRTKGESILEDILEFLTKNNFKKMYEGQENIIKRKLLKSDFHKKMVTEIMQFIGDNYSYFPMYAHPIVTKFMLLDVNDSPLFQQSQQSGDNEYKNIYNSSDKYW